MNEGKRFENNFKASVPSDVYYLRLHDSAIGFDIENSTQRFALKTPYDCILYSKPCMCCLELKSVKSGGISFDGTSPMIREHQIKGLILGAKHNCKAGFIFNFRNTSNTYFVPISAFQVFQLETTKKSINEKDTRGIGILIPCRKLKVNYRYDVNILFEK